MMSEKLLKANVQSFKLAGDVCVGVLLYIWEQRVTSMCKFRSNARTTKVIKTISS